MATTDSITDTEYELRKAEEEARLNALRIAGKVPEPGKIWMGGNISQDQFNRLPEGARITPPAPVLQQPRGLLDIARESDRPGVTTTSVRPWQPSVTSAEPTERRFAANEQIQRAIAQGTPANEAIAMYGQGLFAPSKVVPPKPIKLGSDGVGVIDAAGQLKVLRPPTAKPVAPTRMSILKLGNDGIAAVNPIDGTIKVVRQPSEKPATERIEESIEPGTPSRPAEKKYGFLGIDVLKEDLPAVEGTPDKVTRKVVRTVPITAATPSPIAGNEIPTFKTEAEALRSGVKGRVVINGRPARID